MSLWGNLNAGNNAPKQTDTTGYGGDTPQVTSNGQVYYANTAIAGAKGVNSFVKIFTGGGGKGGSGQIAANVEITVNTTGFIDGIIIGNSFGLYANTPAIANVYTDTHFKQNTAVLTGKAVTNAVFSITVGGRAGRIQTETLVAMGSMSGDSAASNAVFDKS